jgi:heme ABC exporter ATP-binding subunit CcmA
LAGADLDLRAREIVLLEGPNGAGKTTLLRLCAGLLPLRQGTGRVLGHDLGSRPGRRLVRRAVGLLGHRASLYEELTVEENIRFWARANRALDADIEPALQRLGLDGRLRSVPVGSLSAGQRRRASLAVVVCRRAGLWLLDEPHAGFDTAGRDLVDLLVRDAADAGATVLCSSHERDRAGDLANRVVQVIGGQTRSSPDEHGSVSDE